MNRVKLIPLNPQSPDFSKCLDELTRAAAVDKHSVLAPTHLMLKDGEITGYLSMGAVPMVHAWFDSQKMHAGESLQIIDTMEAILRDRGVNVMTACVREESPFSRHMEELGYEKIGTTVVWAKKL